MFKFLNFNTFSNIVYLPKFFLDGNVSVYEKLETTIYILLIISPVDILPELLVGGLGLIDDTFIFIVLSKRILSKLDKYDKDNDNIDDSEDEEETIEVDYEIKD
ncbi:MAG: DUF1232 domain-containing protein [Bacillota bacterium]